MESVALAPSSPVSSSPNATGADSGILGSRPNEHEALFDYFGLTRAVDRTNPRHNDALAKIWDWAKSNAENKDRDSVMFEIMRLKNRLGTPGIENNPYLKVEMYVKTWQQARDADERMREMEAR